MPDQTIIAPGGGKTVGKYRIDGKLGEGAMGVVFKGHDPDIDREVAIKTVHRHLIEAAGGEEWLERFAREARAAGRVLHPNLVTIFDYLQEGGVPYLVMERVQATTLEDRMRGDDRLQLGEINAVFAQILSGLACIHKVGIIHRDMKPANVMLTEAGGVKLTDFGIARLTAMDATGAGMVGTPSYMAPEQFAGGDVDARADIYACGVLLYEMITGRKPFQGGGVEALFQAVRDGHVDPPSAIATGLPSGLDDAVLKAMAVDPANRFAQADDLAAALTKAFSGSDHATLSQIAPAPSPEHRASQAVANTMLLRMSSQTLGEVERQLIAKMGPMGRVIARRAAATCSTAEDMIDAVIRELARTEDHEDMRDSILRLLSADAGPTVSDIQDDSLRYLANLLKPELGPIALVLVKRLAPAAASLSDLVRRLGGHIKDPSARQAFLDKASAKLDLSFPGEDG